MARRESNPIGPTPPVPFLKTCYFYAPLQVDLIPTISRDENYTVYRSAYTSITEADGLRIAGGSQGVMWNTSVPVNENLTFGCWFKRTGGSGVNYSFGCGTKNNARYYGLQLSMYSSYWLMQEYLYFCSVSSTYLPITNTWCYLNWTIIYNDSNNYTCKFHRDGALVASRTFSNTQWLGMTNCFMAISHFTNTTYGYYKNFTCFEELTDSEVLKLYQNDGVPL